MSNEITQKGLCKAIMERATRSAQYNAAVKYLALRGIEFAPQEKTGTVDGVKVYGYLWDAPIARVVVQLANGVDPYVQVKHKAGAKPASTSAVPPKRSSRKKQQISYKVFVKPKSESTEAVIWNDSSEYDNKYAVVGVEDSAGDVGVRFFATLGQARDHYNRSKQRPGIYKLRETSPGVREVNLAEDDALNASEGLESPQPLVAILGHEGSDSYGRKVYSMPRAYRIFQQIAKERGGVSGGYSKTKTTILFGGDQVYTLRLDVESSDANGDALRKHLKSSVSYYADPANAKGFNQSEADWKRMYLAARGALVSWEIMTGASRSKIPEFGGGEKYTTPKPATPAPAASKGDYKHIVIAWAERGKVPIESTGDIRYDLGERPKLADAWFVKTVNWMNTGSREDLDKAFKHVSQQGWEFAQVREYPPLAINKTQPHYEDAAAVLAARIAEDVNGTIDDSRGKDRLVVIEGTRPTAPTQNVAGWLVEEIANDRYGSYGDNGRAAHIGKAARGRLTEVVSKTERAIIDEFKGKGNRKLYLGNWSKALGYSAGRLLADVGLPKTKPYHAALVKLFRRGYFRVEKVPEQEAYDSAWLKPQQSNRTHDFAYLVQYVGPGAEREATPIPATPKKTPEQEEAEILAWAKKKIDDYYA